MDSGAQEQRNVATVPTRVLVLADTHGRKDVGIKPTSTYDLVIHCGDMTEESKIHEYRSTLDLLRSISAPVKAVIAGNHEITLEDETYRKHLSAAGIEPTDPLAIREFGEMGEAKALLLAAAEDGIIFLDEGTHTLSLANGAQVSLYANPWTPRKKSEGSLGSSEAGWAFQYDATESPGRFETHQQRPDIFVTHGPPEGVLDYVDRRRAGCPNLFAAVSRARPLLHCFGHIHSGWGAKLVTWRDEQSANDRPSHFTEIDNNKCPVLEKLSFLKPGKLDAEDEKISKRRRLEGLLAQGHCKLDKMAVEPGKQTMFVNAAVEGDDEVPVQPPIVVCLNLPRIKRHLTG